MSDDPELVVPDVCDHAAWSGDEGPIVALGRWPVRWKCDGCGLVEQDVVLPLVGPTPGGLPGLTDAEAYAFLAAIDKSDPASPNEGND